MEERTIALLIDADNIGANYIYSILNELTKYGRTTIRRIYGDWSKATLKPWLEKSSEFSLTPIMQSNDSPKKNASDIALVIDAMDILYSEKVNSFCIVSSDADFNRLAKRLRESGKLVIGIGEQKTPKSFRASYEKFVCLDSLHEDTKSNDKKYVIGLTNNSINGKYFEKKFFLEKTIINILLGSNMEPKELKEIGVNINNRLQDFKFRSDHSTKFSALISQIIIIFDKKKVKNLNIGELKKQLLISVPDLNNIIKESGFSVFSKFLDKKIDIIRISGNNAELIQ